jgi:hypothetical protein
MAQLLGLPGEAGYRDRAELRHYVGTVRLDSAFRNSEFIGDLFVELAGDDAIEDLTLARGQRV